MKNEEFEQAAPAKNEVLEQGQVMLRPGARKVVEIKPPPSEVIKPSELIQISGHQSLTLNARRAITILWHNAHRQGVEENKDYTIELAALRTDANRAMAPVEEAVMSLMQTVLTVKLSGDRVRRVQFLGGNDMSDPDRPAGTLTYSFDKRLVEILRDSSIWGKIALPVLMAFSTKYAVSLYENASQWASLQFKMMQDMSIDDLRLMMGVEDGKYPAFGDLNLYVVKPAVREINALAPFNITVLPIKTGRRVTSVRIGWFAKNSVELSEAWKEVQRSKIGRKVRLSGQAEMVLGPSKSIENLSRDNRLESRRSLIED
jgi:hypothetical protein